MRQRELLEDFKGGHVACRGCRRLLSFSLDALQGGQIVSCCDYLYMATPHQIDLGIFDQVTAQDIIAFGDAVVQMSGPPPRLIYAESDGQLALDGTGSGVPEPEYDVEVSDGEVEGLAASAYEIAEREYEIKALRKQRGR